MRNALMLMFIVAVAQACDPQTNSLFFIDNKSSYTIKVSYTVGGFDESFHLKPKKDTLMCRYSQLGEATDEGDFFLRRFDTIHLWVSDSLVIEKDCLSRENWDLELEKKVAASYKLVIDNNDVVLKVK